MKNTRYEKYLTARLPRELQIQRMRQVIRDELTELQRYTLEAYYFRGQNLTQIARDRNINKSTVCRTLHRAEDKLRRYLRC